LSISLTQRFYRVKRNVTKDYREVREKKFNEVSN